MISQSNAPIDNSARGGVAEVENPTFTEASERANIVSGESIPTLFGKIKKFFTDLKAVAFSGSAEDVAYNSNTNVKQKIDALDTSSSSATPHGKIFRYGKIRYLDIQSGSAGQIDAGNTYTWDGEISSGDKPTSVAILIGQVFDNLGNIVGNITGSVLSNGNLVFRYTGTSGTYYSKMFAFWIL